MSASDDESLEVKSALDSRSFEQQIRELEREKAEIVSRAATAKRARTPDEAAAINGIDEKLKSLAKNLAIKKKVGAADQ